MSMTKMETQEYEHQADLQRLRGLRPIDDDFMRCLFKDNIPLAEMVLQIITGKKDLVITDCQTQKDMKRLAGARSICLDAYGTDSEGRKYDLEIQRADRTRYLKENSEGVSEVCRVMEEMRNETAENTLLQVIRSLMNTTQWNAEQTMEHMEIPMSDRAKLLARLSQ